MVALVLTGEQVRAREILAALFSAKRDDILGEFKGYNPLLEKIIEFFRTCVVPVSSEETLEIVAFMEDADESKVKGGISVDLQTIMDRVKKSK